MSSKPLQRESKYQDAREIIRNSKGKVPNYSNVLNNLVKYAEENPDYVDVIKGHITGYKLELFDRMTICPTAK